jgi:putrescine aminotransferase
MEARGKGLLLGLEFASDDSGFEVARGLFTNKVLVAGTMMNARAIRIEPPLNITYEQIDRVLEILEKVLKKVEQKV